MGSAKKIDKSVYAFMLERAGRMKYGILALSGIQMLMGLTGIGYALLLKSIINHAAAKDSSGFWMCIGLLAGWFCLTMLLSYLKRWLSMRVQSTLENRFKAGLFDALLHASYAYASSVHSAEWMNRLTNDSVVTADGMTEILPGFLQMAVKLFATIGMILVLQPLFLYLAVPAGIFLIVISLFFRKNLKQMHKTIQEKDGLLRTYFQDILESLVVVRSYALEEQALGQAEIRMAAHRQAKIQRSRFSNNANLVFSAVMNSGIFLGGLFCGYGILTGGLDYGSFTAVVSMIGQLQTPFASISGYLPRFYAMTASAERLLQAQGASACSLQQADELEDVLQFYDTKLEGIGLENARFAYSQKTMNPEENLQYDEKPVLDMPVNLYMEKGSCTAVCGYSGCGKSTMMKLLMGIYPLKQGSRQYRANQQMHPLDGRLQKLFAYVPQGNYLMSGSIRQIVSFANPKEAHREEKIRFALKVACAEFVYDLEHQVDTLLGERGAGLSEGQMQRLAIARAVFSGHPILMLDECTSSLDEETEKRVLINLKKMTNKTVMIVTHRKAALDICDSKILMDDQSCRQISMQERSRT